MIDLANAIASIPSGVDALTIAIAALLAVFALVVYIAAGSIPRTIASGSWSATQLNTGRWRVTITPTNASTHASFAGSFIAILANGLGAFWLVDRKIALYNQSGTVVEVALTWTAGASITFIVDLRTSTGSITISGATTGNGTTTFTNTGTYFVAAETLGIGAYNGGGFNFTGTIGQVDDADDSTSVTPDPAPSTGAGAAGALTPGAVTLTGAAASSSASANDPTVVANGLAPDPAPSTGTGGAGTLVGAAVAITGGAGSSTASASDPTAALRTVEIGAHGYDIQIYGHASRPSSVTLTLTAGSSVIIFSGGLVGDMATPPTTSQSDTIRHLGTYTYPDYSGAYAVGVYLIPSAVGGSTTVTQPVKLFSENSTWVGEAKNAKLLRAMVHRVVANASGTRYLTSNPATAVAAAVNFSAWFGSGPVFTPNTTPFGAVPDRGTILDSYLINNADGEVQFAVAGSIVAAGSHSTTWDQYPDQGAQFFEIIFEAEFPADAAPSTGSGGAGALVGAGVSVAGGAASSTARGEDPQTVVTLAPDAAPSTGTGGAGQLVGGAASISGSAGASTASGEDPIALATITLDAGDPAPSTGSGAAGALTPGGVAISGSAGASTASAVDPNVALTPDPAGATSSAPGGSLAGGAVSIAGGAAGGQAGAIDPTTPVAMSTEPAPSTGVPAAGALVGGAALIAGGAGAASAGAEDPGLAGAGVLTAEPAPSTGTGSAGVLASGVVMLAPDPAPSTGAAAAGSLTPGQASIPGGSAASGAGAEDPIAQVPVDTLVADPAPSTGTGAVGSLVPGAVAIAGGAASSSASALTPIIGSGRVALPTSLTIRSVGTTPRQIRAIGTAARVIRTI